MPKSDRWRQHEYISLRAPKPGKKYWVLKHKRMRKNGEYGKPEKWELKQNVPDWIFKRLAADVKHLFEKIDRDDRTYHKELPKITATLTRNGIAQGFKAKATHRDYGDVTWYLDDKPVATVMIADMGEHPQLWKPYEVPERLREEKSGEGKRFRRMERKSQAPIRLVWAVSLHGRWFRLGVGKMRTQEKES